MRTHTDTEEEEEEEEEEPSSPQPLPIRMPDEIARADAANRAAVRSGQPGAKPAAFSFSNEVCRAGVGDAFHSEGDLDAALGLNQSKGLSYFKPALKPNQEEHRSLDHHHHHVSHAGRALHAAHASAVHFTRSGEEQHSTRKPCAESHGDQGRCSHRRGETRSDTRSDCSPLEASFSARAYTHTPTYTGTHARARSLSTASLSNTRGLWSATHPLVCLGMGQRAAERLLTHLPPVEFGS